MNTPNLSYSERRVNRIVKQINPAARAQEEVMMKNLELNNGKRLRVHDGFQHIWNEVHYRISAAQAKRHQLSDADIPEYIKGKQIFLHVMSDPARRVCPCCDSTEPVHPTFQHVWP